MTLNLIPSHSTQPVSHTHLQAPAASVRANGRTPPRVANPEATTIDFSAGSVVEGHEVSLPGSPTATPPSSAHGNRAGSRQSAVEQGLQELSVVFMKEKRDGN